VNKIYNNYLHSLSTLQPFYSNRITTIEDEARFTDAMADLVQTHSNTIPTLANGFLQCRKYVDPVEVTRFLESHLRARIGTRLVAEQHLALHMATKNPSHVESSQSQDSFIGVIDTALRPSQIILSCQSFVGEICELKYGIRPSLVLKGEVDAEFAHIPMHLEYIITELLKNAFRATIESGNERSPIEVTIAAAPDVPTSGTKLDALKKLRVSEDKAYDFSQSGLDEYCADHTPTFGAGDVPSPSSSPPNPIHAAAPAITIRIRDRGGGIPPETLPNIWSYSFTTFNSEEAAAAADNGMSEGLNAIANGGDHSTIAGLGYGLPLGRAYAEYFGGGIAVESMYGWGTDVYLSLQGIAKVV
jgi:signal transduction histidine kinase